MNKVYLIISIDTECDKGPGWKLQRPMSFKSVTRGVTEIFTPLFDEFNLKPTYLLSPEIIQNKQCVDVLKSLKNAELGTHLHGEFIDPNPDWEAVRTKTPQLFYSKEIEHKKLFNLTNLFRQNFGYSPTSFRAGRWGISKHTLSILEDLNYQVDSSVCSFRTHYFNDKSVNFWGAPLQPYFPSTSNIRIKGRMKILEIPATLGNPHLINWPRFILRMLNDKSKIHKKVLGKIGKTHQIKWLRPYKSNAQEMIELSKVYINKFQNSESVVLNMMFHSNEVIPGASPYVQTQNELKDYIDSMKILFNHLSKSHELQGIGLSDYKITKSI